MFFRFWSAQEAQDFLNIILIFFTRPSCCTWLNTNSQNPSTTQWFRLLNLHFPLIWRFHLIGWIFVSVFLIKSTNLHTCCVSKCVSSRNQWQQLLNEDDCLAVKSIVWHASSNICIQGYVENRSEASRTLWGHSSLIVIVHVRDFLQVASDSMLAGGG